MMRSSSLKKMTFSGAAVLLGLMIFSLWFANAAAIRAQAPPAPQFYDCMQQGIRKAALEGVLVTPELRRRLEMLCRSFTALPHQQPAQEVWPIPLGGQLTQLAAGGLTEDQVLECYEERIRRAEVEGVTITKDLQWKFEELCRRGGALVGEQRLPGDQVFTAIQTPPMDHESWPVASTVLESPRGGCIDEDIKRARAEGTAITEELRRLIEEGCRLEGQSRAGPYLVVAQPPVSQRLPAEGGFVLDAATTDCIRNILHRVPSRLEELTEEEKQSILDHCFAKGLTATRPVAVPEQQPFRVAQPAVAALNTSGDVFLQLLEHQLVLMGEQQQLEEERLQMERGRLEEERLRMERDQLEEERLRMERGRLGLELRVSENNDLAALSCVRAALGGLPDSYFSMSDAQRTTAARACPEIRGRLGQLLTSAAAVQSNEECIESVLGRRPANAQDLFGADRRLVEQRCFLNRRVQGRLATGDEVRNGDRAILECIRRTLGRLPSSIDVMTDSQRVEASRACDAGGRLRELLNPFAVDQSNQECIRRELGRLPVSAQDVTKAERRMVEQGCFGGDSIPGRLAAEDEGPRRGFFINSQAGEVSATEKLTDPTTLAVIGILLTLAAASLSLFRGS